MPRCVEWRDALKSLLARHDGDACCEAHCRPRCHYERRVCSAIAEKPSFLVSSSYLGNHCDYLLADRAASSPRPAVIPLAPANERAALRLRDAFAFWTCLCPFPSPSSFLFSSGSGGCPGAQRRSRNTPFELTRRRHANLKRPRATSWPLHTWCLPKLLVSSTRAPQTACGTAPRLPQQRHLKHLYHSQQAQQQPVECALLLGFALKPAVTMAAQSLESAHLPLQTPC